MKLFYLLILSALSFTTQSQNIATSTITWQSTQNFNVDNGDTSEELHTVTTRQGGSVEWTKPDGSVSTFTITEAVGQWSNTSQKGEVFYKVSSAQQWGLITFVKDGAGVKVKLLLFAQDTEPYNHELSITEYKAQ